MVKEGAGGQESKGCKYATELPCAYILSKAKNLLCHVRDSRLLLSKKKKTNTHILYLPSVNAGFTKAVHTS